MTEHTGEERRMSDESSPKGEGDAALLCGEHHKQCHDCGQFLNKDMWIRKDHPTYTHALCKNCISNYDGPEYH